MAHFNPYVEEREPFKLIHERRGSSFGEVFLALFILLVLRIGMISVESPIVNLPVVDNIARICLTTIQDAIE